jgi:hypothetical protein
VKQGVTSRLLTFKTRFFYAAIQAFGAEVEKMLRIEFLVEVWGAPSATHTPCTYGSQVSVLSTTVPFTLSSDTPFFLHNDMKYKLQVTFTLQVNLADYGYV